MSYSGSSGSETDPDTRDMEEAKAYMDKVEMVCNSLHGIPNRCPCGSLMKDVVETENRHDFTPGKRYFICMDYQNDGLHYKQSWVCGIQDEVHELNKKSEEHDNLLRELVQLKVKMLALRVEDLERVL